MFAGEQRSLETVSNPSAIPEPLRVSNAQAVAWSDSAELVIVGFGGAGVAAALQAREGGVDVLAIDRFAGGGATAYSGGIIYSGGTRFQREAGFDDTADAMFRYLSAEGVPVKPETLRRFCEGSSADIDWLGRYGVPYSGRAYLGKVALPPEGYFLYYSGNEKHPDYAALATPAPRGHRPATRGFGGHLYYSALRDCALAAGVRVMRHAPVERLVVDADGRVIGVEVSVIPQSAWAEHDRLYKRVKPWQPLSGKGAEKAIAKARLFERTFTDRRLIRAELGVLLSTGGFAYNLAMLSKARPEIGAAHRAIMRLGSMGCDGAGIRLAQSVGGAVDLMDRVFVGRGISPPDGLIEGVLVNAQGKRFVNEDVYIGLLGDAIAQQPGGKAWLILPARAFWKSFRWAIAPGWDQFLPFGIPALMNMLLGGTRRARSLKAIAAKCAIDADELARTIAAYDAAARDGRPDTLGKNADYVEPLGDGPYFALNMALDNPFSLTPVFTLGGLKVDEESGAVERADGSAIPGLYAAGRTAVGLCSLGYMSGMSIADTVFSGRRIGRTISALADQFRGQSRRHQPGQATP